MKKTLPELEPCNWPIYCDRAFFAKLYFFTKKREHAIHIEQKKAIELAQKNWEKDKRSS